MNEDIKKAWVENLRNGEYKQCTLQLKNMSDSNPKYCCLGVLTDLYLKETGKSWESTPDQSNTSYHYNTSLTPEIKKWSGMESEILNIYTLMSMNDDEGKTFEEIADYIEKVL